MNRFEFLQTARLKRVVIKVGTRLITDPDAPHGVDEAMIRKLRGEILFLRERGIETILVSSGAVGTGRHLIRDVFKLPVMKEPTLARRQALSAIGQSRLLSRYGEIFQEVGLPVAQLLLTARDFRDRRAYLNIGHTVEELGRIGAVPIVNENDTVSTDELQFGDNDLLSAAVTALFRADLLVILTSVEGFLFEGARVAELSRIEDRHRSQAGGPEGPGRGGMETKIRAGELCLLSGSALAILPGRTDAPVQTLLSGADFGTLIYGQMRRPLSARKRWLLFARTQGGVTVDDGAVRALVERGSSLLPAGVRRLRGRFLAGEVIEVENLAGRIIGRGIVNYSYRELERMLGLSGRELRDSGLLHRSEELIHRNNLMIEN